MSWIWMAADEVQGIFPWIFKDDTYYIDNQDELGQGYPWWRHYQGSNKPWIHSPEKCFFEDKFSSDIKWFWQNLWQNANSSFKMRCKAFDMTYQNLKMKGCIN